MEIPPRFFIYETLYWTINHRIDSALPGYLMLSAKQMTHSLAALPTEALAELGVLQASIQAFTEALLQPKRLYIGRFGHDAGHSIHFHFIPVHAWVEAATRVRRDQAMSAYCKAPGHLSPHSWTKPGNYRR